MRDTRAELLTQAELLIRTRGYSGFSYADLAEGVGIRKASIHHHFPAKSDLATALLRAFDARYDAVMAQILIEEARTVSAASAPTRTFTSKAWRRGWALPLRRLRRRAGKVTRAAEGRAFALFR